MNPSQSTPMLLHPIPTRCYRDSFLTPTYPHPPVSFLRTPSPTPSMSLEVSIRMELPPAIATSWSERTVTRLPGVAELLRRSGHEERGGFQARRRVLDYQFQSRMMTTTRRDENMSEVAMDGGEGEGSPPPAYTPMAERKPMVSAPPRKTRPRRPSPLNLQALSISTHSSRPNVVLLPPSPLPYHLSHPDSHQPTQCRPSNGRGIRSPRCVIFLARWDPANPGRKQHAAVLVRPMVAKGWRRMRGLPSPVVPGREGGMQRDVGVMWRGGERTEQERVERLKAECVKRVQLTLRGGRCGLAR